MFYFYLSVNVYVILKCWFSNPEIARKMAGKKRKADQDMQGLESGGEVSKSSPKKPKPLDAKKFGGMTEEEVCKLLLPDHMRPGLDIIFVSPVHDTTLLSMIKP